MKQETVKTRGERILNEIRRKFPDKVSYDLDGRNLHFVCEVEPVTEHSEYDRAVEVIIKSRPHKHLKMTQWYTIISGELTLHVGEETIALQAGDKYTVNPGLVHWAESVGEKECWLELYSEPGWTKADHIVVEE